MWAEDLLCQVLVDYKCVHKPILTWRRSHKQKGIYFMDAGKRVQALKPKPVKSSGTCYIDRIAITAGSLRKDQRLVLLHEIAHWLLPTGVHHGKAFWDLAFELYRKYKVPMFYALSRERTYRKEVVNAYRRNRELIKRETSMEEETCKDCGGKLQPCLILGEVAGQDECVDCGAITD